jgi:hypothetical protein
MNATVDSLIDLDKQLPRGSYTSVQAFGDIMFLGRAAKTHVLAISQYADRTVLKPAIRENFGIRILIQHSWDAWNMLVPRASQSGGAPAAPTAVGRGYVVMKGKPRQTQFLFLEEEFSADVVRRAHDARVALGESPKRESRRKLRRQERDAIAATARASGRNLS